MKEKKVVVGNEMYYVVTMVDLDKISTAENKAKFISDVNKKHNTKFELDTVEIIDLTGKHICKYCGEVVSGTNENLLCDECKYMFGHKYFSEL